MQITTKQGIKRLDENAWRELLAAQASSGLSIKAFCAARGLTDATFYNWRKRLQSVEDIKEVIFRPISIESPQAVSGHVRLELPGGMQLHFSELPPVGYLRALSLAFGGL
jgi:hypothetical protein